MEHEAGVRNPQLHTLIPLADFKAILGIDDREDKLSRFCLITATYTIEQCCKRRFFMKKHFERIEFAGDRRFRLGIIIYARRIILSNSIVYWIYNFMFNNVLPFFSICFKIIFLVN
jgi:hypothetical protein